MQFKITQVMLTAHDNCPTAMIPNKKMKGPFRNAEKSAP